MTTPQSFIDEELKRFDERFGTLLDLSDIDKPKLKFRQSDLHIFLKSSHKRLIQECLKALPPEIIIHEYMPSQNTPENNKWNEYRNIAIKALSDLLSKIEGEK